jgi:hypothetical protein
MSGQAFQVFPSGKGARGLTEGGLSFPTSFLQKFYKRKIDYQSKMVPEIKKVEYRIDSEERQNSQYKRYHILKAHLQDVSNLDKTPKPKWDKVWVNMFKAGDLVHALGWIVREADKHKKEIDISGSDLDEVESRLVDIVEKYCNFRATAQEV